MIRLGAELGRGSRAVVYECEGGRVVKVPEAGVPERWLHDEYRFIVAAHWGGAAAPAAPEVVCLEDGSLALSLERVQGPTMEQELQADPSRGAAFGRLLADLQLELWSCPASFALPLQQHRLAAKLRIVAAEHELDVTEMLTWLDRSGPIGLCHGDLHPHNVVLGARHPVLVDWFDASVGEPAAETARTLLHVGPRSWRADDRALDGRAELHRVYLASITKAAGLSAEDLERWTTIQLVARLAEGRGHDDLPEIRGLLTSW
ncbi:MAG: aminoglycoside phosphotransferase family protein [Microthrixaceae bacterium]